VLKSGMGVKQERNQQRSEGLRKVLDIALVVGGLGLIAERKALQQLAGFGLVYFAVRDWINQRQNNGNGSEEINLTEIWRRQGNKAA
jgi:hypothetical protein